MRNEDLRIGNLVNGLYEDEDGKTLSTVCKILAVDSTESLGDGWGALLLSVDELEIDEFTDYNPIPLTEDWLKRFGFERLDSENEFDKDMFSRSAISTKGRKLPFIIERCLNGSYSPALYMDVHEEIIHIHQLQNLYFALTGEELKLN